MSEPVREDNVSVNKASFNVANVILAIAVLILVLGVLTYFGALPF